MDDATRAQVTAARPDRSTWLSANAGSGKTRVLTDRVARLLLDGVDPQHILCLTYTKAAASEMQNRLFKRLGEWAMLSDTDLRAALSDLGVHLQSDHVPLRKARRLFATAIETPGGLRIQTIHSFCAALLRRFPLEAGVTPQFTEMDDRMAARLRGDVIEGLAQGADAALLADMARLYTGDEFDTLLMEILTHRARFARDADLHALLNLPPDTTRDSIAARVLLGSEADLIRHLLPALRAGGKTDAANCDKLSNLGPLGFASLPALEGIFLTGKGAKEPFTAKIGSIPTKAVQAAIPDLMPALNDLMLRLENTRQLRLAYLVLEHTQTVTAFARVFLAAYDTAKAQRGLMDFDDLIHKTRDLLTDPGAAAWVLFRLDGGIDHILVDEAQDTSPDQWQVIQQLAQELTAGLGAQDDRARTIFVVGDKKQSIYSFQGADPREFDRMANSFESRLASADTPLERLSLAHSFRSSAAILDVVDATFDGAEASGFPPGHDHIAFHDALPGRVDLWPAVEAPDRAEDPPWYDPVDVLAANDPSVVLADHIATRIKQLIDTNHPIPDHEAEGGWRAVTPGDFLILVQGRKRPIFLETIRACKAAGLPVAGADRLKLAGELAVRDLTALLSFLATPEDDLSLAAALRSPLLGWSEQDLFALAQGRGKAFLWQTLRDTGTAHPATLALLVDLRDQVDYLRPYDLIERILTRHQGRARLLSRLGPEAEDGIDALLTQALSFEKNNVDSLTGFLVWMAQDDLEIKRQLDNASDQIRVMTVHGAKGLEAPIVILPDTAKRKPPQGGRLLPTDDAVLWRPNKDDVPDRLATTANALTAADQAERDRLLYVAMTRAEKWLIVAAAGDTCADGNSWHAKVQAGLVARNATPFDHPTGPGLRHAVGTWADTAEEVARHSDDLPLPDLYRAPAPALDPPAKTLSPSDLPGAKALPGEEGRDTDTALREGRILHRLLEVLPSLPPDSWPSAAARIAAEEEVSQDPAPLLAIAGGLIAAPHLAHVFGNDTLAEVPVTANLPQLGGARLHGIIDRLLITPDHILIVDFKSNLVVPATPAHCPDGILRQMGAYRSAVHTLYPDRQIDTAILWTHTGDLMTLPHDLVTDALANTHMS